METKFYLVLSLFIAINCVNSKVIEKVTCRENKCEIYGTQSNSEFSEVLKSKASGSKENEILGKITAISCENTKIKTIPPLLFEVYKNLQSLSASKVQLINLYRDDFKFAENLRILKLSNNNLTKLEEKLFVNLKALEQIDLSHNKIEWIHEKAFDENCGKLKQINLSFNKIKVFKEEFLMQLSEKSNHLHRLNLDDNEIVEIVEKNLVREVLIDIFDLANNKLKKFELKNVKIVSKLVLDGNEIEVLSISESDHVTIRNNKLRELFIGNSTIFLKADNNEISVMKCENCELKHVNLSGNVNGDKILESLQNVSSLLSLEMSNATLSLLTVKSLTNFRNLRSLKIDHNQIKFIADGVFAHQHHLQHLNISYNDINSISVHTLSPLKRLTTLDISANKILKIQGYENMRNFLPSLSFIGLYENKFDGDYLPKLLQNFNDQNMKILAIDGSIDYLGGEVTIKVENAVLKHENSPLSFAEGDEISAEIAEVYNEPESRTLSEVERDKLWGQLKIISELQESSKLIEKTNLILLIFLLIFVVYLAWHLKQTKETLKHYLMQHRRLISSKRSSISTLALEDTFY